MRVSIRPSHLETNSGIGQVIEAYQRYLPHTIVDEGWDVEMVHAAYCPFSSPAGNNLLVLHGMYWTGRGGYDDYYHYENAALVRNLRDAKVVTVPSEWVAETLRRDLHINPIVVPHGIDATLWNQTRNEGYALYNKNRSGDVCRPQALAGIVKDMPIPILSTLETGSDLIKTIGVLPHEEMKNVIEGATVYLALTEETFGIGTLEAMAAGVPVVALDIGNNRAIVGGNGVVVRRIEDVPDAVYEVMRDWGAYSRKARAAAEKYSWEEAAYAMGRAVELAAVDDGSGYSIVIPCYNKSATLRRAVETALAQSLPPEKVVIVDDHSTDGSYELALALASDDVEVVRTPKNSGVAVARNLGFENVTTPFVVFLDGDDELGSEFARQCLLGFHRNSVGLSYTAWAWTEADGRSGVVAADKFSYERMMARQNQIPTCCMIRSRAFRAAGGYRQRYAPTGAGSEDAALWTLLGSLGWEVSYVPGSIGFTYHAGIGHTSDPNYREVDWLASYPWVKDRRHPFASLAKPANGMCHEARPYHEPIVTVVITVGPGHEALVQDAIDSVEAQTMRQWEVVVVWDSPADIPALYKSGYPFAKFIKTNPRRKGAGAARNIGVNYARGVFVTFLDADDILSPRFLQDTLDAYAEFDGTDMAVYTDFYGIDTVSSPDAENLVGMELFDWNPVTRRRISRGYLPDYDHSQAIAPVSIPPYDWCAVNILLPRHLHYRIGGFDETMAAWEDRLYMHMLAIAGVDFIHLPSPAFAYRLNTGTRRKMGIELHNKLITRMNEVMGKARKKMARPCNCGGKRATGVSTPSGEMIEVMYNPGVSGKHAVFGDTLPRTSYGYRDQGDVFQVRIADVVASPQRWLNKDGTPVEVVNGSVVAAVANEDVDRSGILPDDFTIIKGIGEEWRDALHAAGVTTFADLRVASDDVIPPLARRRVWDWRRTHEPV